MLLMLKWLFDRVSNNVPNPARFEVPLYAWQDQVSSALAVTLSLSKLTRHDESPCRIPDRERHFILRFRNHPYKANPHRNRWMELGFLFRKDTFERRELRVFFKYRTFRVPTAQSLVNAICIIEPFWSRHLNSVHTSIPENAPDTFVFLHSSPALSRSIVTSQENSDH